jgi:hypothetical protein
MMIAVDFPSTQFGSSDRIFPSELLSMVPNVYDSAPSLLNGTYDPGVALQSAALVATEDLANGDELLLDYRLSPGVDRPAWYHPVSSTEEQRRWSVTQDTTGADSAPEK